MEGMREKPLTSPERLCGHEIEGMKHNALYDAEVIKAIWEEI